MRDVGRNTAQVMGSSGPRLMLILGLGGLTLLACGPSPELYADPEDAHDVGVMVPDDSPEPEVVYASVLGRWHGTGLQSDGLQWAIDLEVANLNAGPCAVIRYPSIGCSGYWVCRRPSKGSRIEAIERITEGRDRCSDHVAVKIALANDHGSLCYFADDGRVTASGKLRGR